MLPRLILVVTLLSANAFAVDISNPRALMFVGDRTENLIDVISLDSNSAVFRIETSIHPDHIIATPFAPILIYADIKAKKMTFYDLENQRESKTIDLPMVPRHLVLDTTGAKIGVSDDQAGGFALVYPFDQRIEFALDDFPPTPDVLFDPNDVDIFYSNASTGSIGILNTLTQETYEIEVTDQEDQVFTAPSRSLDSRYIYVGNVGSGEVYSMNAFSGAVFKTFDIGGTPARPYTTPAGVFLYIMDQDDGRVLTIEQNGFSSYADVELGSGIDLVSVGRFDHLSLFMSTTNKYWYIFDNIRKTVVENGEFRGTPIAALGSADGKVAYVAFGEIAAVATVDLDKHSVQYIPATRHGSAAFTIGLSNNVCH